ncbi:MAG: biotin transporter BioY [Candidatus Latescibacterota bacterium]|nr:MAG: biotin transporter BioY [Candidatus Latescibacterota bacterium]
MIEPRSDSGTIESIDTTTTAKIAISTGARSLVLALLGATLFALLTFVGANIRVPLYPVPITMQTLFVLLAGAMLGARTGALSQAVYIGMGVVGIPVFAGAIGAAAFFAAPTAGYLVGFVLAAFIVGRLIDRKSTLLWHITVFSIGSLIILLLGVVHLAIVYTHSLSSAIAVGFLPFLLGDAVKVLAAASIYRSYLRLRQSRRL